MTGFRVFERFTGRPLRSFVGTAVATAVYLLVACGPAGAVDADSADDVCAPGANPCNVTSVVKVIDGSVLDFGTRSVNVSGSGQFDFGAGSGKILCGPFSANTSGTAINAKGSVPGGGIESGSVEVAARRLCSAGDPPVPCAGPGDCQLGACNTRRCSKRPTRICNDDAGCSLGICGANKRCSAVAGIVRCDTNADCDYGTCPAQLTCANRGENPVACTGDADCDFGSCSVGTAAITMGGSILGNSAVPAIVSLRAADSVSISKLVNLSSTDAEADGGELLVAAATGPVVVSAKLTATGGGEAQGGSIGIDAGTDVTINEEINVSGGDFDGGSVQVGAGRDLVLGRNVLADSTVGAGFGGEILLDAGRDLLVSGVSSSNKTTLQTNGHTDSTGNSGDGGNQDLSAGRHLTLNANTKLVGRGSAPEANGSNVVLEAGGNVSLSGEVTAKADGVQGAGGSVVIASGGTGLVATTGTFTLTGGSRGGGALEFQSSGNTDFAGIVDVSGSNGGVGGSSFLGVDANASVSGTMTVGGLNAGSLEVAACRVTLTSTARLVNKVAIGENSLIARESMKLLAGSSMTTGGGANTLIYRSAAKPPVVSGTVVPPPQFLLFESLIGCPVCGNAEIDQGETCDDANTTDGDGCSSDCQNEKCLAQTVSPGYPAVPLCEDGNPCTADFCNVNQNGGTCRHPAKNCDDSIACTKDTCDAGNCVHTANDSLCDDANPCSDDLCSGVSGCSTVANSNPCDDGDSCTLGDQCVAKVCQSGSNGCGLCGNGVVNPPEACDDGNATFTAGEYCGTGCVLIPCGKPTGSDGALPKAGDALFTLRAAVGQVSCSLRVCDVDNNAKVSASDALRILKAAVGQEIALDCPSA